MALGDGKDQDISGPPIEPTHSTSRTPDPTVSNNDPEAAIKKRKMSRACNVCRKRKGDFVQLPSGNLGKCLNCFSSKTECVFTDEQKPRKTSKSFIESLEKKVERAEKLLKLLCPDPELRKKLLDSEDDDSTIETREVPGEDTPSSDEIIPPVPKALFKSSKESPIDVAVNTMRVHMFQRYPPDHEEYQELDYPQEPEDIAEAEHLSLISYRMSKSEAPDENVEDFDPHSIYLGKSSGRQLLVQAIEAKEQVFPTSGRQSTRGSRACSVSGGAESEPGDEQTPFENLTLEERSKEWSDFHNCFLGRRRPEFWKILPWEKETFHLHAIHSDPKSCHYRFPPPDLMPHLVNLYFKHFNVELPLLHRPTFERELASDLHVRDGQFGATVLLVCALGAKYSDDPRVLLSEEDVRRRYMGEGGPEHVSTAYSNGWKWFEPAWLAMNHHLVFARATLYELQYHALVTQYLRGTSIASWLIAGIGIRLAQDLGIHRRRPLTFSPPSSVEQQQQEELLKRAMWVLISLDRYLSASTGRPCALHEEDFDLDLPVECDDRYWDHGDPQRRFKQPEGNPSTLTAFTLLIRLNQILATILRAIYSLNKPGMLLGFTPEQWLSKIVSEIDSALNKWFATLPPHLQWDPKQPNEEFFAQSVLLHMMYYNTQLLLHRPFMVLPNKTATLAFPSLEICANAARNMIHIALAQLERTGEVSVNVPLYVTSSAVVLLLKMWHSQKAGKLTEQRYHADVEDIHSCLKILKGAERRSSGAGKLWDLVHGLTAVNDIYVPAPANGPQPSRNSSSGQSATRTNDGTTRLAPTLVENRQAVSSPFIDPHTPLHRFQTPLSSHTTAAAIDLSPFARAQEGFTSNGRKTNGTGSGSTLSEHWSSHVSNGSSHDVTQANSLSTMPDPKEPDPAPYADALYDMQGNFMDTSPFASDGSVTNLGSPITGGAASDGNASMHPDRELDMSMSGYLSGPLVWHEETDLQFDQWGSYLTGMADLTTQYDFLFPPEQGYPSLREQTNSR